ncbi:hypothetical protein D6C90_06822 [Aureobasidium pullulans]|uniref:Glucose-repressible protein n=1 Tax=Aureobasidium pullulans TaxID=5580 RepID=A0A4S9UHG7_AURPU|nr:hypothetical protein D6C90_06822 [Aureobasidium pullulans]
MTIAWTGVEWESEAPLTTILRFFFINKHPNNSLFKPNNQPNPHIKMSAPNANAPNEGIVGQIGNSLNNAAQYVSETVQGAGATASKEANKEKAKGNSADDSISGRVSGAMGAASDKVDEKKHEGSASANKNSI